MILSSPIPFREALQRNAVRRVLPTNLSSAELRELDKAIRDRSFFSARTALEDYLAEVKESVQAILNPKTVEREGSAGASPHLVTEGKDLATARLEAKQALARLGYQPEEGKRGTIQDLSSDRRIELVIRTNVQSAQAYGDWRQSQDEAVLDQFPAYEYFRAEDRKEKRDWLQRWRTAGESTGRAIGDGWTVSGADGPPRMVALKNHPIWEALGSSALFEDALDTFHPPFAFNSGMWWRDVDRDEATALGIIDEGERVQPESKGFESLQTAIEEAAL